MSWKGIWKAKHQQDRHSEIRVAGAKKCVNVLHSDYIVKDDEKISIMSKFMILYRLKPMFNLWPLFIVKEDFGSLQLL